MAYLGHVISADGVAMDVAKVLAMLDWPCPQSVQAVCWFLGLTGYYRCFIKDYGAIDEPMTCLLRKTGFSWLPEADSTFGALQ
jgi:hypothetical protein